MLENLNKANGLIFSPRVMLKLIESGLDKNKSYDLVQSLSMQSADENINLENLCLENEVISSILSKEEILEIFDFEFYLRYTKEQFISLGWKLD